MKTIIAAALTAAALSTFAGASQAQTTSSPTVEAGYANAFEVQGAEVGVGWRFSAGPLHFTPTVGGFIYQNEDSRYYFDSNVDRCRDRSNGQFARDTQCNDSAIDAFGRLEVTADFRGIEAGVGYRLAEESVPYGTVSFKLGETWAVKANAGKDYVGLGIVFRR
jgi:hypothetical protein